MMLTNQRTADVFVIVVLFMHLSISMLSPREGGGGAPGICGALTSIAFSTLGNLSKNLGPRVETFAFLRGGPSHIIPCAPLCAARL